MAVIGSTDVSRDLIRAMLGESSKSIWTISHNPNINKWAKFSPLSRNGGKWIAPQGATAHPKDATAAWYFRDPTSGYPARLGDFRSYTNEVIPPVSMFFPDKIIAGSNKGIAIGIMIDSPYMVSFEDVFPPDQYPKLYPCVCISDSKGVYVWEAADSINGIDLKGHSFTSPVTITYCMSDTKKALSDPNQIAQFYSLNFDGNFSSTKTVPFDSSGGGDVSPDNPHGVSMKLDSLYYPNGDSCTFKTIDGLLGIRFSITKSDGSPEIRDRFKYFINEQDGNSIQGYANYNELEERYVDPIPPLMISAYPILRPLTFTLHDSLGNIYYRTLMPMGADGPRIDSFK